MKTSINIDRLKIYANHGVLEQERVVGNLFEVSLRLDYDFSDAAAADDVDRTVNYAEVAECVKHTMATSCRLLEAVAWNIRSDLLARWPQINGGRITVSKVHPPFSIPVASVGVTVEW